MVDLGEPHDEGSEVTPSFGGVSAALNRPEEDEDLLLELGAEVHAHGQLGVGITGVLVFDGTEDLVAVHGLAAPGC